MSGDILYQALFWLSLFLIFWTYFGYMLALKIISIFAAKAVKKSDYFPEVSLIVTAYNEEQNIERKIENCLSLTYPADKLEIIIVSDGSTDRTEEIIRSYEDRGIKLLAGPERRGKHYGQGDGIKMAKNDLLVLSDATTFLKEDSIEKIVRNFADPEIGCVSGFDQILDEDKSPQGEGAYVKYEMKLRSLENSANSLVGVSGCFYAVRKELCSEWIGNMSADFYLPIISFKRGFRTVLEPEAVAYYEVSNDPGEEFTRKVRTVVHGMEVLKRFKEILNPFEYGFFSIQMISHKLSRWLVPFYLIVALFSNIFIAGQRDFYLLAFICQALFYGIAIMAYFVEDFRENAVLKLPLFFISVNYSILVAWNDFISGRDFVRWEPTKR
jgi:cellulose synthase/poly-beta-1,6-N-acetylglucosamine synthase-like glycosyltransferase